MNTPSRIAVLFIAALSSVSLARAADIDGTWKTEFDSQIGQQKYTYELKADGEKVTGMAHGERADGNKSDVAIAEGKVSKDDVFFVEPLKFQDFDIRVEYSGKLAGDEMKLTRKVGDFATEEIVAHRVKAEAAKPADTKSADAKKDESGKK